MKPASFLFACLLFAARIAAAQAPVDLGTITERHELIPMRDGQRLSAYLYVPPGNGPWPAVFEQRYADLRGAGTRKAAAKLAEAGYAVALVNFRGTHLSEGTWVGYRALGWGELKDGYDTCEWLAKQSWCTGNIGTFGSSQGGYAQNFLAVTQPPHLKCQYMVDTGLSLFQEGYRLGGTTRPQRFLAMASNCRNPDDNRRLLEEWFQHPNYDDYWKQEDCSLHFDKMNVPCFTIGSWYDFMNQGSIASFIGRQHHGGQNSRGNQQLVIGPWLHGGAKGSRIGDLVYPDNAAWPAADHMVRWFDHYLKGKDNGIEREPTVCYYVMGAVGESDAPGNVWRNAANWPPKMAATAFYLQANGGLSLEVPTAAESSTEFVSDPFHPMQIPGTSFPGAKDARPFEQQSEVRTFTTEPLAQAVEWTGRVFAELCVSSTARDTDFILRISDVYPDGRSMLICDYPWRARYREGFDHQALLTPGKVHSLKFDVGWISQIFNRGHRIRVTIGSTGAPLYEPNPQTGEPLTIEFSKDAAKAINTIHHSRVFSSRIVAMASPETAGVPAVQSMLVREILSDSPSGKTAASIVGDVPLVYLCQIVPSDKHPGDAAGQLDDALDNLDDQLHRNHMSDLDQLVKLNLYIAREDIAEAIQNKIAERFRGKRLPATSLVTTSLLAKDVLVTLDAVAAVVPNDNAPFVVRGWTWAAMPSGCRLYISGQADGSKNLLEATRKTLESLSATLKHCGRTDDDVVHIKCFMQPMTSAIDVQHEIARHFGFVSPSTKGKTVPPVSFVEWRSASPQIEIELVAWGGPANYNAKEPLEFITPPGMTKSPVYSRVARIHHGGTIFFGDVASPATGSVDEQLQASFDTLGKLLAKTGSDFEHLAKATYYVTDDEIAKAHHAIRPKFFDPDRPPAASKALIQSTGHLSSRYSMDMIAVPSSRGTPVTGPELGYGLSAKEAAEGWISLFDGETTFGWKDATVGDGLLRGGTTTTTFGRCQLRGEFAGQGTLTIGGQEFAVGANKPLAIQATPGHGPIRVGSGVAVKSLAVRPLDLQGLFNGRDLSGWKTIERQGPSDQPSRFWRVERGAMRAVSGPGAIEYGGQLFGDFVLQIDVRSQAVHSNGGLFFRAIPGQFMNGYEAQIHNRCLDNDPSKPSRYTTGGIDDRQDARRLVGRDFEPFRMTVIADGPHIATWVNGYQVTDWTDDRPPHENPRQGQRLQAGAIQLQAHDPATDYEVRGVFVKEW